jgi:hypothetical protein
LRTEVIEHAIAQRLAVQRAVTRQHEDCVLELGTQLNTESVIPMNLQINSQEIREMLRR